MFKRKIQTAAAFLALVMPTASFTACSESTSSSSESSAPSESSEEGSEESSEESDVSSEDEEIVEAEASEITRIALFQKLGWYRRVPGRWPQYSRPG